MSSVRLLLVLSLLLSPLAVRAQQLTGFAAAGLTDAMKDVSAQCAEAGHRPLRLSFGSSSTPALRIEPGAPANLFASADQKWMDYLSARHLVAADTRKDLLGNDLVLVVPAEDPQHVTTAPGIDLLAMPGPTRRLATGDPAHVPVGIYAEQALSKLGLRDTIAPRLARTAGVRSALLLVQRGEAPGGIVYATDAAASPAIMVAGTFPPDTHPPIV